VSIAPLPAPGWYRDPSARHAWRYWDGQGWTDHVASDGRAGIDPVPDWVRLGISRPEPEPVLPPRAIGYGLAGMLISVVLGYAFSYLGHLIRPHSLPVELGVGQIGLWSGLIGTCIVVSRRLGTGHFVEDFGWRFKWIDVAIGLGLSVGGRLLSVLAAAPFYSNPRFRGSNTGVFTRVTNDTWGYVVVSLIACVGAPLVEELFFRGLIQRSLASRFGGGRAVVLQAILFGAAHMNPYLGMGNVTVIVAIGVLGLVLGATARQYRRLGPSSFTHAFFNLTTTLLILALG
jgi:membrane protease YdiL (CAAX protease family)